MEGMGKGEVALLRCLKCVLAAFGKPFPLGASCPAPRRRFPNFLLWRAEKCARRGTEACHEDVAKTRSECSSWAWKPSAAEQYTPLKPF